MPNDKQPSKRPETDSQKIVHRHLENEKDIITDEDIRNIKIDTGVGAHDLAETDTGAEAEARFNDTDENNEDTQATAFDAVK